MTKSRTRKRQEEREQQRRRNRQVGIVIAVVVVAVIAAGLWIISNLPADAPVAEDIDTRYEGLASSTTDKNYPILGDPDAPVRVVEFSSFSCPGCAQFHEDVFPTILDFVQGGDVSFTYVPLQTGSVPNAEGAAMAALCAGEQGKFWEMHDTLFDWHVTFANTAFSGNRLKAGIEALGLDGGTFDACFGSQSVRDVLDSALGEGVNLTPTVRVNGVDVEDRSANGVSQAILEALAAAGARDAQPEADVTAEAAEVTPEATEAAVEAESTAEATAEAE